MEKNLEQFGLKNNIVKIIDQTKLPHQFIIKDLKTLKTQLMQLKLWRLEAHH